jgi:hypothetical protein
MAPRIGGSKAPTKPRVSAACQKRSWHWPLQGSSGEGTNEGPPGRRSDVGRSSPRQSTAGGFFLLAQLTLRKADDGMNVAKRARIAFSIDTASRPAWASSSSRLP